MRISDWSSDVCSSDLGRERGRLFNDQAGDPRAHAGIPEAGDMLGGRGDSLGLALSRQITRNLVRHVDQPLAGRHDFILVAHGSDPIRLLPEVQCGGSGARSEEHTSELQSLMRISYAVFCLKKTTANLTNPLQILMLS